jgi:hypothetical protein
VNGRLVTAGLLVLGSALIVAAARGTLWFDELLSLQWARSAQHPWQLLELYRHDNNHPLNTLWLMLVGEDRPPIAYRVLSVASGITTNNSLPSTGQASRNAFCRAIPAASRAAAAFARLASVSQ